MTFHGWPPDPFKEAGGTVVSLNNLMGLGGLRSPTSFYMINCPFNSCFFSTVCAAIKILLCFDAVTDDSAAAVLAFRRESVNGTLEAIEIV